MERTPSRGSLGSACPESGHLWEQEETGTRKQLECQAGWGAVRRGVYGTESRWDSGGLSLRALSSGDCAAPALDPRTQNKDSNSAECPLKSPFIARYMTATFEVSHSFRPFPP